MKKFAFLAAFGLFWIGCKSSDEAAAPDAVDINPPGEKTVAFTQVQAIFDAKCIMCHGENGKEGIDLRSYASVIKGGEHGAIVKPGEPSASEIIEVLREDNPQKRMPKNSNPLPEEEIKLIESWISAGAKES